MKLPVAVRLIIFSEVIRWLISSFSLEKFQFSILSLVPPKLPNTEVLFAQT